jgi:hypothetical protein
MKKKGLFLFSVFLISFISALIVFPLPSAHAFPDDYPEIMIDNSWDTSNVAYYDLKATHPSGSALNSAAMNTFIVWSGVDCEITRAILRLKKTGNPTANIQLSIYLSDSNYIGSTDPGATYYPIGNSFGSSNVMSASSLSTTVAAITFNFSDVELPGYDRYCLILEVISAGVDNSNYVSWEYLTPAEQNHGIARFASNAWTGYTEGDSPNFQLYGVPINSIRVPDTIELGAFTNSYPLKDEHPSDSALVSSYGTAWNYTHGFRNFKLTTVNLMLYQYGSADCYLQVRIFNAWTGTLGVDAVPSGAPFAESVQFRTDALSLTDYALVPFDFIGDDQVLIELNHAYLVELIVAQPEVNTNVYPIVARDTVWGAAEWDDQYNAFYYANGAYLYIANWQMNFEMLGQPQVGVPGCRDLENIDDAHADWVFTDWKYYTFYIDVQLDQGILTELALKFTVPIGSGFAEVGFYSDGDNWIYGSNLTDLEKNRFGDPVNLKAGTWTTNWQNNTITFPIWFNDQVLDVWEDPVDIWLWANFTDTGEIDWHMALEDAFNIYSKGGFAMDFQTTDATYANKLVGEEWSALYGYEGTEVSNTIWYRDLQHIKMLPEIQSYAGYETYYVRTTVDYSVGEGEWLPGWRSAIQVDFFSWSGVFAANVWVNMSINWYQGQGIPGSYAPIITDNIYMFYHGSVSGTGAITRFRFWNDMWFNNINASSTGGGRINAYEYPMHDNADAWLRWLANNWGVKDDVPKESTYMGDLLDTDGNVMSTERIKMVRVTVELEVADADAGQLVYLNNYDVMDYTHSPDLPLTGVQTPVFDETKMPTVGNTGILGAIFSMFSGIGQWLSENVLFGGLNLWGNFVAFLDTIAGWLGAPGFFSNLFAWIGDGMAYLVSGVTSFFEIVLNFFLLFGQLLGTFLTTIGQLIASLLNTLSIFVDIMGGVWGGAGNLWTTLGIANWLILAMVFYPLYLVYLWEQEGMDAVVSQLTMIFGILSWLFHFFVTIATFISDLVTGLIESIPVAE